MFIFVQQVCFTPKNHNLCLLWLDWDNIYLERGGEEREVKAVSVFQTQMIALRMADEMSLRNMQRFCLGENISKPSFTSEIPYISDTSGGLYDVVCSRGRNKIRLSDIYTKAPLRCDGSKKSICSYPSNNCLRYLEVYHRKILWFKDSNTGTDCP